VIMSLLLDFCSAFILLLTNCDFGFSLQLGCTGYPVTVGHLYGHFSISSSGSGRKTVNCQISELDILIIYY